MREDQADSASGPPLERFFWPRSIAVIGASGSPRSLSARPLRILQQHGYPGRLYPVNPRHGELRGLRCYPSVTQLPEIPDLALVLVSAAAVPAVVDDCGRAGICSSAPTRWTPSSSPPRCPARCCSVRRKLPWRRR
jgi:predicted CoA-binding protein